MHGVYRPADGVKVIVQQKENNMRYEEKLELSEVFFTDASLRKAIDAVIDTGMDLIFNVLASGNLMVEGGGDVAEKIPYLFRWEFNPHQWEKVQPA